MRLWGELISIAILVSFVAAVVVMVYLSRISPKPKKLQPATWVACDYTMGNETIVIVELRRPIAKDSEEYEPIERREVKRIINGVIDYDQQYYNAMQDAATRAMLLNTLHN